MEKYITTGAYYMIQALYKTKEERNMILDPLTCIIRLAILKYKQDGTKISIHNNRIYFQPPGVSQGVSRWVFGDKRSDLSNLHNPILKATEWFVDQENQEIRTLFQTACEGLLKLQDTYGKHTLTSHALNDYIEIINRWLAKKPQIEKSREFNLNNIPFEDEFQSPKLNYDHNKILDIDDEMNKEPQQMNKEPQMKHKEVNSTIHQQLMNLWNMREIQTIKNLFECLESHTYSERNNILEAIEIILEMKENYVNTLIREVSTIL